MKPEIDELIHRYLDARATPDETAALSALLSTDPEAAERFAELTRGDEGLRVELKAETRTALFTKRLSQHVKPPAPTPFPNRRQWLAAAALILIGSGAWWLSEVPGPPALGKKWAAARLERITSEPPEFRTTAGMDRPVDPAAELRRELRGFTLPYLHLRSMPLTDALATLNRQWKELPHADGTQGKGVAITLSPQVRAAWTSQNQEPKVTVDLPEISLHTALQLIAAQAGLKMEIDSNAVTLEPDPRMSEPGEKTWTFPLAQTQADAFLPAEDNDLKFLRTLERSQIFLTHKTHSPELTNLGYPRVSMYPDFNVVGGEVVAGYPREITLARNSEPVDPMIHGSTTLTDPVEAPIVPNFTKPAGETTEHLFASPYKVYLKATEAPDTRTLPGWLATFGLPGESLNYNPTEGVLTVTGNPRLLHTASAAVAALTESSQAGVSMEMRLVASMDGIPVAFPGKGQGETAAVDDAKVEQFCKAASLAHPPVPILRLPAALSLRDRKISYTVKNGQTGITSMKKLTGDIRGSSYNEGTAKGLENLKLEAGVTASKSGGRWNLTVEVKEETETKTTPFSVREGQWMALRLGNKTGVLLVRPKAAAIIP